VFQIDVSQNRNDEFVPKIILRYQRDVSEIKENVILLYGRGIIAVDIHDQLRNQ
jgi:transposase-like protein